MSLYRVNNRVNSSKHICREHTKDIKKVNLDNSRERENKSPKFEDKKTKI